MQTAPLASLPRGAIRKSDSPHFRRAVSRRIGHRINSPETVETRCTSDTARWFLDRCMRTCQFPSTLLNDHVPIPLPWMKLDCFPM